MKKEKTIGWAIAMKDDGFIPDFSVIGKLDNVLQIHSDKKSAEKVVKKIGKEWEVKKVEIVAI